MINEIHQFIPADPQLTIDELDQFIEDIDHNKFFASRKHWSAEFVVHCQRIFAAKQYIVFRRHGKISGFCSWVRTTREDESKIVKNRWLLPETITEGDIFYIDICLLSRKASIFKIKDYLVEKYKPMASEIFWFDMPHRKVFRLKFKGGALWQQKIADF